MKITTDPMNMDALDFDGDMWDPEYYKCVGTQISRSQW